MIVAPMIDPETGYDGMDPRDAPEPEELHVDGLMLRRAHDGTIEAAVFGGRRSQSDPMWLGMEFPDFMAAARWAGFVAFARGAWYEHGDAPLLAEFPLGPLSQPASHYTTFYSDLHPEVLA